ncbi:hypothetical protein IRZ71_18430 [Flavobacterium sp. ANB]|uniref:hypothetical protein n=1 Tax=unclassified Flavobacterium TaxID=196869 RepID=UPI0012B92D47|nr:MULTISPECIES: hypothetical protein [unclassified Flavobacterium]MBF4518337.1 hypothetical protein [Flavobacterium sp. ANB]MTD70966.1 hypothetical protein [Flavobacterium sp. LC2016-13]
MANVNPLTMYVPILQTPEAQALAEFGYKNFINEATVKSLNDIGIVHYARIALVPNTNGVGTAGVLVITEFDDNMNTYLKVFFNTLPSIKATFIGIMALWANKPADFPTNPDDITFTVFENFINDLNLNNSDDLYCAYPQSVKQIVAKFAQP